MKYLIVGDTIDRYTGLGYVALSVARRLKAKGHEILYAVVSPETPQQTNYSHWAPEIQEFLKEIKVIRLHGHQEAAQAIFDTIIKEHKPEKVMGIHDPWFFDIVSNSQYRPSFEFILYCTLENDKYPQYIKQNRNNNPVYINLYALYQDADYLIPVTEVIQDYYNSLKVKHEGYIHNGLDEIYPEFTTKEKIFGCSDDDFVFFAMGTNIYRKMLGRTIFIFSEFLNRNKKRPYKLVIHTDPGKGTATDLISLCTELGVRDHVLITGNMAIPQASLYARYHHSDCYLGLTGSEGFGYGFAEAMYNGLPIIYTNYGSHTKYCKDIGIPVSISDTVYLPYSAIPIGLCDIKESIKAMERIASNKKLRDKLSEKGKMFAYNNLMWDSGIFDKLERILTKPVQIKLPGITLRRI